MKKNKLIKIILIVVLIIIIALIATFVTIYFIEKGKMDYSIESIDDYKYSILYKDDKYGVINKDGEIVVEPTYSNVQIPNPSKPVFICVSDYNSETGTYDNKILNDQKQQILTTFDRVTAISVEATDSNVPYEKSVLRYEQGGKYGLIDFDGNQITEAIYDEISGVDYKEGTLLVKENDQYGIININGATIIRAEYDEISADNYYDSENKSKKAGFIVRKTTDEGYRYGYISYDGKKILDTEYTKIERVNEIQQEDIYLIAYKDGQAGIMRNNKQITNYEFENIEYNLQNDLFIVQRNSKKGLINKNGETVINTEYDDITFGGEYINAYLNNELIILDLNGNKIDNSEFVSLKNTEDNNYYIAIDKDDLYTVLDVNRNNLLSEKYDYIEYLGDSKFIVMKDRKSGVIDNNNNFLIEVKYNSLIKIYGTNLIQAYDSETDETIIYNKDFQEVGRMQAAEVNTRDNYVVLISDNNFEYFNYDGEKIEEKNLFSANLIAYSENGKWGFKDKNGNIIVNCEYDMVTEINEYGYAGIKKDGKWGSIDSNGKIIQEPVYTLNTNQPSFIGKYYKIESWTGENCYSDNQTQEDANNEIQ